MDNQILDEGFNQNEEYYEMDPEQLKRINLEKIELNANIKDVKNARVALIVLTCFAFLGAIINLGTNPYNVPVAEILIESAIIFLIYLACAIGVRYNPRVAITTGIAFYLLVIMLSAFVEASSILSGIIVKLIIIYYLGKGVQAAFSFNKNIDKLFRMGVPTRELDRAKELIELRRR